jgi:hypothetical protein
MGTNIKYFILLIQLSLFVSCTDYVDSICTIGLVNETSGTVCMEINFVANDSTLLTSEIGESSYFEHKIKKVQREMAGFWIRGFTLYNLSDTTSLKVTDFSNRMRPFIVENVSDTVSRLDSLLYSSWRSGFDKETSDVVWSHWTISISETLTSSFGKDYSMLQKFSNFY